MAGKYETLAAATFSSGMGMKLVLSALCVRLKYTTRNPLILSAEQLTQRVASTILAARRFVQMHGPSFAKDV